MRINLLRRSTLLGLLALACAASVWAASGVPAVKTDALSQYDKNAPIGFGASTTGSGDENPVTVKTLAELKEAFKGTDKRTIYIDGTIQFTGSVSFKDVKNKTVYGLPGSALANTTLDTSDKTKSGIMTLSGCDNIILRNLTFLGAGAYDYDGNDNLTVSTCTNIWVDHCDFQDGTDGNFDCNNGSDNICVSWCRFRYLKAATAGGSGGSSDHRFSNLWGNGDKNAAKDEGKLRTTFYACWWDNGCKQRMPRVRFGQVHILNCLYASNATDVCIGAGYRCNVYAENNVFSLSKGKAWQNYATSTGYTDYNIQLTGNQGAADEVKKSGSITQFVPAYTYDKMAAADVEAAVKAANGAGATLTFEEKQQSAATGAATTLYSWQAGNETGGKAVAANTTADAEELAKDISSKYIRLRGKNDFSTQTVTITFDQPLHGGDVISVTAYRNKDQTGKTSGFKAKFEKGSTTVASQNGTEFVNIHASVAGTSEYGTEANACEFVVPADADGSTTMTMTRSHAATNLFITKLLITTTASGEGGEGAVSADAYTNTWYFGKSNGSEEFALQKSAEYTYTVGGHSLVVNTDAGKLNNASRTDQWGQCNNGTTFKIPVYRGAKITWGRYNGGSETGFTVDGQLYNEYYVATADQTVSFVAQGISYLSYIKVEPINVFDIQGTVGGANIDGASVILTAKGNGQSYSAKVTNGAFETSVPADTYVPSLSSGVAYVVGLPATITVSKAGSIGEITLIAASEQMVTGSIANAPAEAFILTFTAISADHTKSIQLEAGSTDYSLSLMPDTYTISSSTGTLSPLSVESFEVLTKAATHNIYFPEAAVPAATQQQITVDQQATVAPNIYNKVGDALAAAKAGGISAPVITLASGQTFREQVKVDMADVTLKTSGTEKAKITFYYGIGYAYYSLGENGYYDRDRAMTRNSIKMIDPARWGATVLVTKNGKGFRAENIIFENSFNQYYTKEEVADGVVPNGVQSITVDRQKQSVAADSKAATERAAALAFENNPTGCQLYDCTLIGSQDTYYTSGTIYNKHCDIQGNTDYIFGGGYVVFDECTLTIGGYSDKETSAYITAYKDGSTLSAAKRYVFRDCTVRKGSRPYVAANLGRDWGGSAASVYFLNLKNENLGSKLSYSWNSMSKEGGVSDGTADLHIYDFDATVNKNYQSTGTKGSNINGTLTAEQAKAAYTEVVAKLGFTPERVYDITLDENSAYNAIRIAAADGGTGNVSLKRSIKAGNWSTICLPFALSTEQVKEAYGDDVKLAEMQSYEADTKQLVMAAATAIEANKPYMIRVSGDVSGTTAISGVTYADSSDPSQTVGGITMQGVYQSGTIAAGDYFVADNQLYRSQGQSTILPFRAYFTGVPSGARLLFLDDMETTDINRIYDLPIYDLPIYNLSGQRISQPRKGIVIVGGRKVVK